MSRALITCCAVALAQHLGHNRCYTQQPPRGWLPLAQHAILGAQDFFHRRPFFVVAALLFAVREKKMASLCPIRRRREEKKLHFCNIGEKKKNSIFSIRRRRKKIKTIFPIRRVEKNKMAPFGIRRRLFLFSRHFLLFAVAEIKFKSDFRYST